MAAKRKRPKVISRQDARAKGLQLYFTGTKCARGHLCERRVKNSSCIYCTRERAAAWQRANPEKVRKRNKQYAMRHPERVREKERQWRLANPQKVRAKYRRWWLKNKHAARQASQAWYWRDIEKSRARGRDVGRRRYREKRSEVLAALHHARARRKQAPGRHTASDLRKLLKKQRNRCNGPHCRCDIRKKFTVDHIRPLSRGGSNDARNLQLLCFSCNSSKGKKTMAEWLRVLSRRHLI